MDADDLHDLATVFLDCAPVMAASLRQAAASGDLDLVRRLVHRLSGTLGFFDERAAATARRLEGALATRAPDDIERAVRRLDREVARVLATLETRVRREGVRGRGGQ